ncbi:S41 family peptidase [Liquorilactobacillus nagelii]|uniref:S41 family peptidase n=1 Tax=Liquorilactobacillus nagelii TaxID=82688 RepID=UPI0006EED8BA|nr:S41 family peptidase [Liquorilactobacillus nagelii]KRL40918.1 carboxy-terminal processing protease [Liquorilactobacillus nagelii DSM 13675]QYH53877.1 S41 family peptidase [Liquorilactobacillus nagelii DSM 13675]
MFKQKKTKTAKRFGWLTIICSSLTCLIVGGGIVFLFMNHQLQEAEATNQSLGKISTVYSALYNNYYKSVSRTKLVNGALNGMVDSLGDPFSEYMSKSETESLSNTISSSFTGIGAEVQKSGSHIQIISPIKGTPAEKAGLKAKDIIEKIDGKSITGYSVNKAVSLIRGKKGTSVTLTIKRGDQSFTKTLKRATIPVKTVSGKIVKNHPTVGYVQVSTFSENTAKEFKAELKSLQKKGAKSFIIDMRDNPGGLMDQALKMSSIFVKNGKVLLRVQQRTGAQQVYRAGKKYDSGYKITGKTVVLINSGSASAAEIFSAALHQSAGDQLIGTKSYGKGTVQNTLPFSDQTELKMTIAKWLTPNGDWINHKGLQPTIKADYPSYAYQTAIDTQKTYQQGQVSNQIKKMQVLLNAMQYSAGQANGYFSDQTVAAVKKFQQDNKLTVSGKADAQTINKLEEKVAEQISQRDNAYQAAINVLK